MASTGRKHTDPSGWVYAIVNPAWPGCFKIGKAARLRRRLGTYQTGSPNQDYRIWDAIQVPDRHVAERIAHEYLLEHRISNEWFRCPDAAVAAALDHTRQQFGEAVQ